MKPLLICPLLCLLASPFQEKAILDIEFTQIRSRSGLIRISVYTDENQYPYHPARTYELWKDSLKNGTLRTEISDLTPGRYALCFLDDENNSGALENNLLGIPREGFGFANNVKPLIRRPDYDRLLFQLRPGRNRMQLTTLYRN